MESEMKKKEEEITHNFQMTIEDEEIFLSVITV